MAFNKLDMVFRVVPGTDRTTANVTGAAFTNALNSEAFGAQSVVFTGRATASSPGGGTVTANATTNLITITGEFVNFALGTAVEFTTSGSLPEPLQASTTYYVIPVGEMTFQVATTYTNAINGVAIDITSAGTNNSVAPVAFASATFQLQGSWTGNEGVAAEWFSVPEASVAIEETGAAVLGPLEFDYIRYPFYRWAVTMASGNLAVSNFAAGVQGGELG